MSTQTFSHLPLGRQLPILGPESFSHFPDIFPDELRNLSFDLKVKPNSLNSKPYLTAEEKEILDYDVEIL